MACALPFVSITGLGCAFDGRCVRSTGYGGTGYSNNQACTITNPPAVLISVTSFAVETHSTCAYDYLTVNGARYCGSSSPEGVVPDGTPIEWHTDGSVILEGWELCFPLPIAWDTSNVTSMDQMFYVRIAACLRTACPTPPATQDLSHLSLPTTPRLVWQGAQAFNQPLAWDVSGVTSMLGMFLVRNAACASAPLVQRHT